MIRQVVILADDSAHWKIAGLRQLDRLALELNEVARAQDATVAICIQWLPEVPPRERFVPHHPRITELSFEDLAPESADLRLSTHFFLPRRRSFPADFAERLQRGEDGEYLESAAQIAACEKKFLRSGGKSQDGLVSRYFNRPLSRAMSRALLRTGITPNAWTLLIFIFPLVGAAFLARGDYVSVLAGLLFFQLYSILDGCDGEIARAKYLDSPAGAKLDTWCDTAGNLLLVLSLGYGLSRVEPTAFHLGEGITVAILVTLNEILLALPRSVNFAASANAGDALYPRHRRLLDEAGLSSLGGKALGWVIQLTKRDVALVAFLFLALLHRPAWILHLLGAVAALSSLLALQALAKVRR